MVFCSKRKGKKGIMTEIVAALIILAITALILFGVLAIWKIQLENYVRSSTCAMSAVIKDKFNLWGYGDVFGYELKCNPVFLTVKPDADIHNMAIDEMYGCWKTLGRGELDIISNFYWGETDTTCVVCSSIKPSKGAKIFNMAEFEERLNNYKVAGADRTFANYFSKSAKELRFKYNGIDESEITKVNPLYIVYFFYKTNYKYNALVSSVGAVPGAVTGGVIGSFITPGLGTVVGAGVGGMITGIVANVPYKNDLKQGIAVISGEKIVNGCNALR